MMYSLNINFGHNQELMEACRDLYEYSYLVEQMRIGVNFGLALTEAVDRAAADCIEHDVLKDFLLRHRAEVANVILEEFDLNKHIKSEKALSFAEGEDAEQKCFSAFYQKLIAVARNDDAAKAVTDYEYCKTLYEEYIIN